PEKLLLQNENNCIRLPMREQSRSLNLSNSVAIGVYEVLRQWKFPTLTCEGKLTAYNWGDMI
ncbi:MAG: tRNA (uridine(34)/cytosine(34)/5-carboxymethylaminomethyluridine(34)-2'-O)-methyltransferase TrmL, partial [Oscillospiraceae bacterium]